MLKKVVTWAAVIVVGLWVYHQPDQAAAVVQHVVHVLGRLAGKL